MIIVKSDQEIREILLMLPVNPIDKFLRGYVLGLGAKHDRGPVGVIGANPNAVIPLKFLQADPNVGLNRLHQMAQMDVSIGVGKCACDKNFALFHFFVSRYY